VRGERPLTKFRDAVCFPYLPRADDQQGLLCPGLFPRREFPGDFSFHRIPPKIILSDFPGGFNRIARFWHQNFFFNGRFWHRKLFVDGCFLYRNFFIIGRKMSGCKPVSTNTLASSRKMSGKQRRRHLSKQVCQGGVCAKPV
jgi:hypothetical protein